MQLSESFRIVHVSPRLRLGAGRYVVDAAIAQHRREPGRVAVVIGDDAGAPWASSPALVGELQGAGVAVLRAGHLFERHLGRLKLAAAAIRSGVLGEGLDWPADGVVHVHSALAAVAARWAGAPHVVLTGHGWGPGRPEDFDLEDALASSMSDLIIAPCERWAALLRERSGRSAVPVIPYGYDITRFPEEEKPASSGPVRILNVGELSTRNGVDLLLEAMSAVWERFPEAQLHFIGEGAIGAALRQRARALDPSGARVVFHGLIDQPSVFLRDFDIFAMPCRGEDEPWALLQAMAAGLPVVSTRVPGVTELVETARCGFLVAPEDVGELAAALRTLIEVDATVRRLVGSFGAGYARTSRDITTHIGALDALYRRDAGRRREMTTMPSGSPTRLRIGCATGRRGGWINIDARPEVEPDVVACAHQLSMFDGGSADTIEAFHLLQNLPLHEARLALREWARVLRVGGELLLELPDFEACLALAAEANDDETLETAMTGIFGSSPGVERHGDAHAHHWGWSPRSLTAELEASGFELVEQLPLAPRASAPARADFRLKAVRAQRAVAAA